MCVSSRVCIYSASPRLITYTLDSLILTYGSQIINPRHSADGAVGRLHRRHMDPLCSLCVSNELRFAVLFSMRRQQSRDRLRASCRWISSSRLWDWTWQLAQWRWFMTGQESQRWMRRNNFDQSFPLTTEESSLSRYLAGASLSFPEGSSTGCRLIMLLLYFTQRANSRHADTEVHITVYMWFGSFLSQFSLLEDVSYTVS